MVYLIHFRILSVQILRSSASVASPARLSPNAPLGDPVSSVTGGFWDFQWDYTGIGILVGGFNMC